MVIWTWNSCIILIKKIKKLFTNLSKFSNIVANGITQKQYELLHEKIVNHFGPYCGYAQQFLFAITFNQNRDYMPLPAGIFEFIGYQTVLWNEMMAASLVGVLPVLFIFLFMQKHLIAGLTSGAVKEWEWKNSQIVLLVSIFHSSNLL